MLLEALLCVFKVRTKNQNKMKVKITIEDGKSKIVLLPETTFEKRIVEDMHDDKKAQDINVDVEAEYKMHGFENHRIVIDVIDQK